MKILMLCCSPEIIYSDVQRVVDLSSIYAYYYHKYFSKFPDCELTYRSFFMTPQQAEVLDEFDFCLVLVQRGILRMKRKLYKVLRKKVKYQIITFCENSSKIGEEDLLMMMMGKVKDKCKRIYWGAYIEPIAPIKPNLINILVDHKYYGNKTSRLYKMDKTETIIKSLLKYRAEGNNIVIRHIGRTAVNEVDEKYVVQGYRQGGGIDFRKINEIYKLSHIFVVTHPEGFGYSIVESAAAGALIVHPENYVKKPLAERIHHAEIPDINNINWKQIINKVNVNKSRSLASFFSYQRAANQIYQHMKQVCR